MSGLLRYAVGVVELWRVSGPVPEASSSFKALKKLSGLDEKLTLPEKLWPI